MRLTAVYSRSKCADHSANFYMSPPDTLAVRTMGASEQSCNIVGATRVESRCYAKARSIALEAASPPRTACV